MRKILNERLKALEMSEADAYLDIFSNDSTLSRQEWEILAPLLTVPETFFFRDKGQMALLRNWILPQLIQRHKKDRCLRLWSAGCSFGAEPYSLAILLHELLPDLHDWNILIFGSDMNAAAIRQARKGLFSVWSFRSTLPDLKEKYFHDVGTWAQIDESFRDMVTFKTGNLVNDSFPSIASGIHDMDLIMCRNVFIYFGKKAISSVSRKFTQTLTDGGFLMTGHAELMDISLPGLNRRPFSDSLIYERGEAPAVSHIGKVPATPKKQLAAEKKRPKHSISRPRPVALRKPLQKPAAKQEAEAGKDVSQLISEAKALMAIHKYQAAIEKAEEVNRLEPGHFETLSLIASAYANMGEYAKAADICRQAIEIHPFEHSAHYLLSQICEAQGDREEAMALLKKAVYLEPAFIPAYLEIAALYEMEIDATRAKKMRHSALRILEKLPQDETVEPYEGVTVSELICHIRKML